MKTNLRTPALLLSVLLLAACGSDPAEEAPAGALTVSGALASSPARMGNANELRVEVTDAQGNPVTGALLTVEEWMPTMGHGAPGEPSFVEEGNGVYRVSGVNFSMRGPWEIRVHVERGGQQGEVIVRCDVP